MPQYILTHEEYSNLVHKDRIRGPVKEFTTALEKIARQHPAPFRMDCVEIDVNAIRNALETLKVKLDL